MAIFLPPGSFFPHDFTSDSFIRGGECHRPWLSGIAKWQDSLNSQSLVYDGDRQAPPDLLNLFPEETDLDPDTWLTHHMLILAFLRRIANASNIQPKIFLKELIHIYKILRVLDTNKFPPNVHIILRLRYLGEISPKLEKPPTRKDTAVSTTSCESYAMYTLFLNGRFFILRVK
jgi:hypothetical protein